MRGGYASEILKLAVGIWLWIAPQPALLAAPPTLWWKSQVDNSVPYWAISLALDAYGSPHMAYHDFKDGHLKYASKQGGTWTIENLDNSQFSGEYVSLAFGASGNPHIAYSYHYSQATNAELRYASRSGRKWTVETIDSLSLCCAGRDANVTVSTGMWTSLAIDASDKPHVAFWRYVDSDSDRTSSLIYATKGDNSWKLEILDSDKD